MEILLWSIPLILWLPRPWRKRYGYPDTDEGVYGIRTPYEPNVDPDFES